MWVWMWVWVVWGGRGVYAPMCWKARCIWVCEVYMWCCSSRLSTYTQAPPFLSELSLILSLCTIQFIKSSCYKAVLKAILSRFSWYLTL